MGNILDISEWQDRRVAFNFPLIHLPILKGDTGDQLHNIHANFGVESTLPSTTSGKKPDLSGYNYGAIASLVLAADKSFLPRRDKEPDGAPTSLSGRIDVREMGSRVMRETPKDLEKKKKAVAKASEQDSLERQQHKQCKRVGGGEMVGYADVIEATQDVEGFGAKTNVAMLTILNELGKHLLPDGTFDLDSFEIIYIAPMKALVREMVGNFSTRLEPCNIKVGELTVDAQMTKDSNHRDDAGEVKGLFYFDASYRLCGLQQQFVGVTEKKAIKQYQVMNEVCYEKVPDQAGKNQSLVFIHSRKETAKTAKYLRDRTVDLEDITKFVKPEGATREVLPSEVENVRDPNLKDLQYHRIQNHHHHDVALSSSSELTLFDFEYGAIL
ncbi:hypothetical protein H1R20_g2708, partial [Candolleomyces eurysporus]